MTGVCGVDADIQNVLDALDVIRAFRQVGYRPFFVAELEAPIGPVLRRPRSTDGPSGHPQVVVPTIQTAHPRGGRSIGPIGPGGDTCFRGMWDPRDHPTHSTGKPYPSRSVSLKTSEVPHDGKTGEGIVDGNGPSLAIESPCLAARRQQHALCP